MQTTFLSALFLTGLGYLLTFNGQRVDAATQSGMPIDFVSVEQ